MRIDAVCACPFHLEITEHYGDAKSHWCKPGPGLVLAAARILNIKFCMSWLVGGKTTDVEVARNAGLAGAILLDDEAASLPHHREQTDLDAGFQTSIATTLSGSFILLIDVGLLRGFG